MTSSFRFAVIADSHIRLPGTDVEGGYPSNAVATSRNREIVDHLNRLDPAFVVHLGDIVHPIPALDSHEDAVRLARDIYDGLNPPLYLIPGNHDIGDKANAWMPAPVVDGKSHRVYEKHWGPLYQSFDVQDCHFIMLDTPVLNSGLPREQAQFEWLEKDLRAHRQSGRRLFVCLHYPLFLYHPDEVKHYDNIEQPARSRLLELLQDHRAEAVFSGHVHNFFYNRWQGTDHYIVPSTAFVRPEYAELAAIGPGDEFGRNDEGKLGFFMVHVDGAGHRIEPVRSRGAAKTEPGPLFADQPCPCPLAVSLRHSWAQSVELTTDGLDEFTRKKARRDGTVQAIWELGVETLRVPVDDLLSSEGRARMDDLTHRGQRFIVFVIGLPSPQTERALMRDADLIKAVEVILPEYQMPGALHTLDELQNRLGLKIYMAPVVGYDEQTGNHTFQHFASHGFRAKENDRHMDRLGGWDAAFNSRLGITFRISPDRSPWDAGREIQRFVHGKSTPGKTTPGKTTPVLINLQLPRRDEGVMFDDRRAIANHLTEALLLQTVSPETQIILDTFMDHDRGYYPRLGLIDRRFNPHPSFMVLKNLQRFIATMGPEIKIEAVPGSRQTFKILNQAQMATVLLPGVETVLDDPQRSGAIDLFSGVQPESGDALTAPVLYPHQ